MCWLTFYLKNEFYFWKVYGIMNTSGLLQSCQLGSCQSNFVTPILGSRISRTLDMIDFVGLPPILENHIRGFPWKPCIFT